VEQKFEILSYTPEPVKHIERCARTSYKSKISDTEEKRVKFIRSLIFKGHESVLEHSSVTVKFIGHSRAFTHQLVRHRLMSITQESQRFVNESGFYEKEYYVIPKSIKKLAEKNVLMEEKDYPEKASHKIPKTVGWSESYNKDKPKEIDKEYYQYYTRIDDWFKLRMKKIDEWYRQLLERLYSYEEEKKEDLVIRKATEDARFLLPNAVCSEIIITANFREWRHIFKLRCSKENQWEIRDTMIRLLEEFHKRFYPVFEDIYITFGISESN